MIKLRVGDKFRGDRGTKVITITGYDLRYQQITFTRDNYAHECALPATEFRRKFTEKLD